MNPPLLEKKSYWCKPLTGLVSVLDIGMYELLDSDVNDNSGTARALLSGTHFL